MYNNIIDFNAAVFPEWNYAYKNRNKMFREFINFFKALRNSAIDATEMNFPVKYFYFRLHICSMSAP
jgi:hypothetical protein